LGGGRQKCLHGRRRSLWKETDEEEGMKDKDGKSKAKKKEVTKTVWLLKVLYQQGRLLLLMLSRERMMIRETSGNPTQSSSVCNSRHLKGLR
jgi:hypothetical protein